MSYFLTVLFSFLTVSAFSQHRYVAPDGNDRNPGTIEKPYRTLAMAGRMLGPGDTCFIRAGTYRETIRPANSGRAGQPIVFINYADEQVTLSGTETLKGWSKRGKLYTAPFKSSLGNNNQLFIEGEMKEEARWPNADDTNLMTREGANIETGGSDWFRDSNIPENFTAEDLVGKTVWMLMGKKWTSQTAPIVGYEPETKRISFKPFPEGISRYMAPGVTNWGSDKAEGHYYISGFAAALDQPGEWIYDQKSKEIQLVVPEGFDPYETKVECKVRKYAIDLTDREHVQVIGVNIFAAAANLDNAKNCLLQDIEASYISHTSGGFTAYSLEEESGFIISGNGNTLRESKITYSAGNGVQLSGEGNQVINNEIAFTDYIGNYAAPLKISGSKHLVSHNSIHDTGRDCIQIGGGPHLVQYNDIYHAGWIAHDLGMTYIVNQDGQGTEIHHNWFHDNLFKGGTSMGLYLDNFTANYLIHHNVMWGTADDGMRFNRPEQFTRFFNNTVFGTISHWGRWDDDDMTGLMLVNNIVTGGIQLHPEMLLARNYSGNVGSMNPEARTFSLPDNAMLLNQGMLIEGVNDHISDGQPDLGAYESGEEPWKPGPDFDHPPRPEFQLSEVFWKNYIHNGSFEYQLKPEPNGIIPGWKTSDQGVKFKQGEGGISMDPDQRSTRIGRQSLQLEPGSWVSQTISVPAGKWYNFYGWAKSKETAAMVEFRIKNVGVQTTVETSSDWMRAQLAFQVPEGQQEITVEIANTGNQPVYIEDIGVFPVFIPAQ